MCIMEVATPTEDCLVLIHDLLCPIIKSRAENSLNRQEVGQYDRLFIIGLF